MEPEINQTESRLAPLQKVTPLSKYLAMALFVIVPFIGGWIGYSYHTAPVVIEQQSIQEAKVDSQTVNKKSFYGGEIPVSWSTYSMGDSRPADTWPINGDRSKYIESSFAERNITFGDWNSKQVDFYLLSPGAGTMFIDNYKTLAETEKSIFTEEKIVGGMPAIVITWSLDNGEVTKVGPGGSSYLIKIGNDEDAVEYLLIEKQAKGDDGYEKAFSHYLKTVDFIKYPIL